MFSANVNILKYYSFTEPPSEKPELQNSCFQGVQDRLVHEARIGYGCLDTGDDLRRTTAVRRPTSYRAVAAVK